MTSYKGSWFGAQKVTARIMTSYKGSGFVRARNGPSKLHHAMDATYVANGGKGPAEVGARCGRDVAAGMGAPGAGAGAAGPPHPKRARGSS